MLVRTPTTPTPDPSSGYTTPKSGTATPTGLSNLNRSLTNWDRHLISLINRNMKTSGRVTGNQVFNYAQEPGTLMLTCDLVAVDDKVGRNTKSRGIVIDKCVINNKHSLDNVSMLTLQYCVNYSSTRIDNTNWTKTNYTGDKLASDMRELISRQLCNLDRGPKASGRDRDRQSGSITVYTVMLVYLYNDDDESTKYKCAWHYVEYRPNIKVDIPDNTDIVIITFNDYTGNHSNAKIEHQLSQSGPDTYSRKVVHGLLNLNSPVKLGFTLSTTDVSYTVSN